MTIKEYFKWFLGPHRINNYTNSPRYYSSSRWLEGGQDVRTEISITEMDDDVNGARDGNLTGKASLKNGRKV